MRKARIVVIDDDLDIQELLVRFFKTKNYESYAYGDAQQALEDLTQEKI